MPALPVVCVLLLAAFMGTVPCTAVKLLLVVWRNRLQITTGTGETRSTSVPVKGKKRPLPPALSLPLTPWRPAAGEESSEA
ncbi:uncharacterized protein PSFLO_06412 [Pseudozyma flocculosa]|uniref:Secreted protein n=1 Tax=Pseudozyma flocculosa TaxID=84751 RepID=A0A5C3F9P0_9BASI|nr:uncharacterized protein PSFLO_06412 [Pseudozyma flocculosa]